MLLTTAVALGVALTGCASSTADTGSSPSATTSTSASPSAQPGQQVLTAAQAKAALPTTADFPSGWTLTTVDASNTPKVGDVTKLTGQITYKPAACQAFYDKVSASDAVSKAAQATKAAEVATNASSTATSVAFSISSYKTIADAEQPLKSISDFSACKSFTATTKLGTYSYEVSQLTPPGLGDDRVGWSMTATIATVTLHITIVTVRLGHNLVTAVETSTSDALPVPYEPILKSTLTKLGA